MDHGGQIETKCSIMSQLPVTDVDLYDNLPVQPRNLNEANAQNQSLSPQTEAGGGHMFIQTFNNNGKFEEEEQDKQRYTRGGKKEEEEQDNDEVMKEEEEESEESSSLINCQSPDTPMTDSSYSETASLLETPNPFSPETSPEPTSPVLPVISPEPRPMRAEECGQRDVTTDRQTSSTAGPTHSTSPTTVSDTMTVSARVTGASDSSSEPLTSSMERVADQESENSPVEPVNTETLAGSAHTTRLHTPPPSTAVGGTPGFRTSPSGTNPESTSTIGSITSDWDHIPDSVLGPTLLESLEQLAQRGDDTHLPHHLHQIAETFVLQKDYQRALCCIQLERLYHQRVLENLSVLQEQWESQCKGSSSDLATQHLDTLKHICQTHSRPSVRDAVYAPLDCVNPVEGVALPSCVSADEVDGGTEHRDTDPRPQSGDPVTSSLPPSDQLPQISSDLSEDLDQAAGGTDGFPGSQLTEEQGSDRQGAGGGGGATAGQTIPATENVMHPSSSGEMDQSKPAEQQEGDLGPEEGKEAKAEEERHVEKRAEMEDEGDEEEKDRDPSMSHRALPVDTLGCDTEVEEEQLQQELQAEEELHSPDAQSCKSCQQEEADLSPEPHIKYQEEEEEEEEYEVEQADIIREAATLDDMAKRITVEEMSPASGLVSILKKRSVCVEDMSAAWKPEPQSDKHSAKRRVRFRVPDDEEQEVGGGDSCLLLFLLCLVTVVISVGGTALYCALGDAHSSVCQDFSRNAGFYFGQIQRGITQIQHWFTLGS